LASSVFSALATGLVARHGASNVIVDPAVPGFVSWKKRLHRIEHLAAEKALDSRQAGTENPLRCSTYTAAGILASREAAPKNAESRPGAIWLEFQVEAERLAKYASLYL
jgi:hypothetical protein